jgi:hypothetical protein
MAPACELGLAGGGKRRALLVAHADPFDAAPADRVRGAWRVILR